MAPAMALFNESVVPAKRGSFMTLISSVQQLSASLASYGGGWILGDGDQALQNFPRLGMVVAVGIVLSLGLPNFEGIGA